MTSASDKVFFECTRNGRQWPNLAFAVVFGAFGVYYLAGC